MAATIDLRTYRQPLNDFLGRSVYQFVSERPGTVVSVAAFYVFPYEAIGGLCLDTPENSRLVVEKWEHKGPDWYGEDEVGRFNDSPEDFAFLDFASFEFMDFPDLYHVGNPIVFIDFEGKTLDANREKNGDDGINRSMFPSFCAYVREFAGWNILQRSDIFRTGVVMHDSWRVDLWRYTEST